MGSTSSSTQHNRISPCVGPTPTFFRRYPFSRPPFKTELPANAPFVPSQVRRNKLPCFVRYDWCCLPKDHSHQSCPTGTNTSVRGALHLETNTAITHIFLPPNCTIVCATWNVILSQCPCDVPPAWSMSQFFLLQMENFKLIYAVLEHL